MAREGLYVFTLRVVHAGQKITSYDRSTSVCITGRQSVQTPADATLNKRSFLPVHDSAWLITPWWRHTGEPRWRHRRWFFDERRKTKTATEARRLRLATPCLYVDASVACRPASLTDWPAPLPLLLLLLLADDCTTLPSSLSLSLYLSLPLSVPPLSLPCPVSVCLSVTLCCGRCQLTVGNRHSECLTSRSTY